MARAGQKGRPPGAGGPPAGECEQLGGTLDNDDMAGAVAPLAAAPVLRPYQLKFVTHIRAAFAGGAHRVVGSRMHCASKPKEMRMTQRDIPHVVHRDDQSRKFRLDHAASIATHSNTEWQIKRILPKRAIAALFGERGNYKSFIALHVAFSVAAGADWAGRRTDKGPVVYVAAEGAAGVRKRIAGMLTRHPEWREADLFLIDAALNLGVGEGDRVALIRDVRAAGVRPALIVIDTLAAAMGGADENGAGMNMAVRNVQAIARELDCAVLFVHHTGHQDKSRMRGHSSLGAAVDVEIRCERVEGARAAALTITKMKDDEGDFSLRAALEKVCLGEDDDGDEISTLVVARVEAARDAGPRDLGRDEAAAEAEVETKIAILRAVNARPNASLNDIAEVVGLKAKSTVSGHLSAMARNSLTKKIDGRWSLTKKGREAAEAGL